MIATPGLDDVMIPEEIRIPPSVEIPEILNVVPTKLSFTRILAIPVPLVVTPILRP